MKTERQPVPYTRTACVPNVCDRRQGVSGRTGKRGAFARHAVVGGRVVSVLGAGWVAVLDAACGLTIPATFRRYDDEPATADHVSPACGEPGSDVTCARCRKLVA